jgi:hypothetical protein
MKFYLIKSLNYSLIFLLFFGSCNNKQKEIERRRELIKPFLNGKELTKIESDGSDFVSIQFNSDSSFLMKVLVEDYRENGNGSSEIISKTGKYTFFEDKIALNESLYFPVLAFDGITYEQFLDTISFDEKNNSLCIQNESMESYGFQVYLGIIEAENNSSYINKFLIAKEFLNGKRSSEIVKRHSKTYHFK